jgi:hypothetical protein
MTVLEKIKRCVSLVWDFQEIYCEEDIEEFCHNELHTYPQHDEIMEYFKHIEECEKCYSLARAYRNDNEKLKAQNVEMQCCGNCRFSESDKLNGTFCHREGCFVVASAKCKLWER